MEVIYFFSCFGLRGGVVRIVEGHRRRESAGQLGKCESGARGGVSQNCCGRSGASAQRQPESSSFLQRNAPSLNSRCRSEDHDEAVAGMRIAEVQLRGPSRKARIFPPVTCNLSGRGSPILYPIPHAVPKIPLRANKFSSSLTTIRSRAVVLSRVVANTSGSRAPRWSFCLSWTRPSSVCDVFAASFDPSLPATLQSGRACVTNHSSLLVRVPGQGSEHFLRPADLEQSHPTTAHTSSLVGDEVVFLFFFGLIRTFSAHRKRPCFVSCEAPSLAFNSLSPAFSQRSAGGDGTDAVLFPDPAGGRLVVVGPRGEARQTGSLQLLRGYPMHCATITSPDLSVPTPE